MIARVSVMEKITLSLVRWLGKEGVLWRDHSQIGASPVIHHSFGQHCLQDRAAELATERPSFVSLVGDESNYNRVV